MPFDPNQTTSTDPNAPGTGTNQSQTVDQLDFVNRREMVLPVRMTTPPSMQPGGTVNDLRLERGDFVEATGSLSGMSTIGDALSGLNTMDPDLLGQLQEQLYAGHFYAPTYYKKGHPPLYRGELDDATVQAYSRALRIAARQGTALDEVLKRGSVMSEIGGGDASGLATQITRITDPAALRTTADKIGKALLGRKLTKEERDKVTSMVTGKEVGQGQQEANVQAGVGGPTGLSSRGAVSGDVVGAITKVANELGVDPALAIAIARQESGLNPRAVGDNGTSFGLFQLHKGGELGKLSPEQAMDPETAARVSLSVVASVAKAHPDWSPGQIAAAAQRPANQAAYAASVNSLMGHSGAPSAVMGGGGGGGTAPTEVVANIDPQAQLEEGVRNLNPAEAGAHDSTDVYSSMLDFMRKGA